MFKKTLVAAAVVTVIAASAFAQSYDPDLGSGNIANIVVSPTSPAPAAITYLRGSNAYAQAPGANDRHDVKGHAVSNSAADMLFERAKGGIE